MENLKIEFENKIKIKFNYKENNEVFEFDDILKFIKNEFPIKKLKLSEGYYDENY
jgi:hypothetical protein